MKTKTQHTATPWSAEYDELDDRQTSIMAGETFIAATAGLSFDGEGGDEEDFANAAFIVHAVNVHYELVGLLLQTLQYLEGNAEEPKAEAIRAALARVEPQP